MNRNRIAIARGNSENLVKSKEKLASGQPVYNYDKRYLTVGQNKATEPNNEKTYPNSKVITVRDLIGWFADNDKITATADDADKYYVIPTETGLSVFSSKTLDLEAAAGIKVNSDTNINDNKKLTAKNLVTNIIDSDADKIIIKENGEKTFEINRFTNINKNIKFADNTGVIGKFQVVSAKDSNKNLMYNEDGLLKNTGNLKIEGDSEFIGDVDVNNLNSSGIISVNQLKTQDSKITVQGSSFKIAGNVEMDANKSKFTNGVEMSSLTVDKLNTKSATLTGSTLTVDNLVIN